MLSSILTIFNLTSSKFSQVYAQSGYSPTACVRLFHKRVEIVTINMSQKRSFVSPPKTQTFIVTFTAGDKRPNANKTTTRSPIARAQEAILGPLSRKNKLLSNNPFGLLAEEDNEMNKDDTCKSYSHSTQITTNSVKSPRKDSTSTPLINKARRASEKLRKAKAVLLDNSLRLELEQLTSFGSPKASEERDKNNKEIE